MSGARPGWRVPGESRKVWAAWCWTPDGEEEWLTALFDLEEDARLYAEQVRQGRRIRPWSAGHAGVGARVEEYDGATRLGTGRPLRRRGGGEERT